MLGEAKTQNDTLSAAYTALQAEYIKLKTQQQYDYAAESGYFDPTLGANAGDGRLTTELDSLFVYSDMGGTYGM
jgi:hypothetical protein